MSPEEPRKKGLSANWAVREVDHLFSKLAAYTRFVLFGKWFLLAITLALVTSLIAWPLLTRDRSGLRVSFVDNSLTKGGSAAAPVMNNPQYTGADAQGRQFKINGLRATQVTPSQILIEQIDGQLLQNNGGWKSLKADRGNYYQDRKQIELMGNVNVLDDQGYNFVTEQALIDTATMDVTGNALVRGDGPMGNLLASGFEIRDSGKHIIFMGGAEPVHVHIDQAKQPAP